MKLTKYFLDFEKNEIWNGGFGITAWTEDDAISQLKKQVFKESEIPNLKRIKEITSLDQLDQGHVIPNMEEPISRGIWYPLGFRKNF